MNMFNNIILLVATLTSVSITTLLPMEMEHAQENAAISYLQQGVHLSGKWVLVVGCGTGNVAAWIAKSAEAVLGLDSQVMIDLAKSTHDTIQNLGLVSFAALNKLMVDGHYCLKQCDVITSFFWEGLNSCQEKFFQNFYKDLNPGGRILVTIWKDRCPALLDDELRLVLEQCGFESISIEQKKIEPRELILVSAQKPFDWSK